MKKIVPFNICQYALLTHMYAHVCGRKPKDLIVNIGDAHIYLNHVDGLKMQLGREPKALPKLKITGQPIEIDQFTLDNFVLEGYDPHPHIKFNVSV